MKLVVDENIAFAKEAFSQFGEALLVSGRAITNDLLKDADILIVRSITTVDKNLLQKTKVKFVGTATIGTDHIDKKYLKKEGIAFHDAEGCNADSVAEYVFTALLNVAVKKHISLKNKTIGIIGVGNVGSRVVNFAEALGLKVLKSDPPKEREGIGSNYVSLEETLRSDIVTLHVPLNQTGIDKTIHLLERKNLDKTKEGSILINTSRGVVIDNDSLLNIIAKKRFSVILDVWEGEPSIDTKLLEKVDIGTTHVAGYSFEGKVNGTRMIYDALCKFTNQPYVWKPVLPKVVNNEIELALSGNVEEKLHFIFKKVYNIENDNTAMKKMIELKDDQKASYFDKLRRDYPLRREFNNYTIILNKAESELSALLRKFRFNVKINNSR